MKDKRPEHASTGKVVWNVTMSVDGFIAPPDGRMDWVFGFAGPNPAIEEIIATTGAVLAGRNSYDVGHQEGQPVESREVFGGAWTGPQFVLTHHPPKDDPTMSFLSGDIRDAVGVARTAGGEKNLLIIGADVARQALLARLVDEIVILLAPVLLGSGTRLFDCAVPEPIVLEPAQPSTAGQVTNLRYHLSKKD